MDAANALGRVSALKGAIMGVFETPSEGTMKQVESARAALNAAMAEVGPLVDKARAVSTKLAPGGVTFKVPEK